MSYAVIVILVLDLAESMHYHIISATSLSFGVFDTGLLLSPSKMIGILYSSIISFVAFEHLPQPLLCDDGFSYFCTQVYFLIYMHFLFFMFW